MSRGSSGCTAASSRSARSPGELERPRGAARDAGRCREIGTLAGELEQPRRTFLISIGVLFPSELLSSSFPPGCFFTSYTGFCSFCSDSAGSCSQTPPPLQPLSHKHIRQVCESPCLSFSSFNLTFFVFACNGSQNQCFLKFSSERTNVSFSSFFFLIF